MIGAAPLAARPVTTLPFPPGAVLCFYTDGLVERPGQLIDEGLERLCRAVVAESPEAVCAAVMGDLVGSESAHDDIALLAIRRQAPGAGTTIASVLPPASKEVRADA
jgi:serine phosphatase RsbU (regulator of sigma subunit)